MFLKNIRLTNFKCYESLFMDFTAGNDGPMPVRKTTFVTGENGTGKTALLQAIALVMARNGALKSVPGLPDDFIQAKKRFCEIEATVIGAGGEEQTLRLRMTRGQSAADVAAKAAESLALSGNLPSGIRADYCGNGFGAGRRLSAAGAPASRRKQDACYAAYQSLFGPDAVLRSPDAVAADVQTGGGKAGLNALLSALNSLLPPEVRAKNLAKTGSLQFETPDGVLPLAQIANGYQQTVAWVSELVYYSSQNSGDYKKPLAAQGLLLIDGIDLNLHPAWQRRLHAMLAEALPDMQVIATTYSPLTAQQAGRDELYALRRDDGDKVTLVPFVGDPSSMLLHQLLMSPIFGLETDESLKVETAKAAIRAEALSGKRSAKGKPAKADPGAGAAMAMMAGPGGESDVQPANITVNTRSNSSTDAEDIALLQQINAALKSSSAQTDKPLDA